MTDYYVFVYGTLKKGWGNNQRYLSTAQYIRSTMLKGISIHYDPMSTLPFAKKNPKGKIVGDIFKVDKMTLRNLDMLEAHPEWYKRVLFQIKGLKVWIYLNPDEADYLPIIPDGIWKGKQTKYDKTQGIH